MATAVVQVNVEDVPRSLSVPPHYGRALVVVRRRQVPVAQFYMTVRDGVVDRERFARSLRSAIGSRVWTWKAQEYVGPESASETPPASVAICTRERPEDLARALRAVTGLRPAPHEILVIDNAPVTDRTREIVSQFRGVRYIREDIPGLDAARNRALREARTAIVAFSDDDAVPEEEWLERLLSPFQDPRVRAVTGLTLPLELETAAQEWFERYSPFGRGFERRMFDGSRDDPLAVSRAGAGANMALRRAVLDEVGGFDEALDAGTATYSGGDHEMFARILAGGYRIVYEPAAVSWHRHRRTWPELRETLYGYGVGVYAMWTRKLLFEKEPAVFRHACRWLFYTQLPHLWRALRRHEDAVPLDLQVAQGSGCLAGPAAYFRARRSRRIR